jgi:capsular exopolysaccharide synthesis family protein
MAAPKKSSGPFETAFGTSLMDRVNVFFKLRRYIKMVAERWIVLALCTIIAGGIALHKAMNTKDKYRAWSEIGIAPKLRFTQENNNKAEVVEELNSFYERQLIAINSDAVRKNVEKDLSETGGGSARPPEVEPAADRLKNGNIRLGVDSPDLNYARAYASAWAKEFLNYRDQVRAELIDRSARETRDEIARYDRQLAQVREDLFKFQETNNIVDAKEKVESLQRQSNVHEAEYNDLKIQIEKLKKMDSLSLASQIESQGARRGGDKSAGGDEKADKDKDKNADSAAGDPSSRWNKGNSLYPDLKRKFELKQAEVKHASLTLKPMHPHMVRLNQELESLQQQVTIELANLEEMRKANVQSLELNAQTFPDIIKSDKEKLLNAGHLLINYLSLKDRESTINSQLAALQKRMETLSVPPEEEGTFTILTDGTSSGNPINPNRAKTVLTGVMIGLAIGLGIIYALGRLDDRLELAEEIEAELEEPVLGQIPLVDKKSINAERVMITRLDEHSMFAESIRGVRSAVMLGAQGGPRQVMLITSAIPGDGKTTFTVNFAVTLAIAGNRVLLVDADLRRGNIHGYFDLPRDPGYAEVLQGEMHWRDVAQKTEVRTLDIIGTGKLPPNPGELLMSPINKQFIEEIRQTYDYIIFDCPPLTAIDDTFSLVGSSDGMLFVVRSGQTSMRFAAGALDAVRKRGAQVMGLVLNGITEDNPYYYYKNYYHEYYSKGTGKPAQMSDSPLPTARMATPKAAPKPVSSIEERAKALAGQEHLAGGKSSAGSKAEQFKAIRAAKKSNAPSVEAGEPED